MVDEAGCYTPDVGDDLKGKFVLKEGNETILKLVESDILKKEQYVHSYPYDWRTKKPVILRASKQWFINTDAIKDKAIVNQFCCNFHWSYTSFFLGTFR